jgi:hypothetical protein
VNEKSPAIPVTVVTEVAFLTSVSSTFVIGQATKGIDSFGFG